jgi:hypothetical protein
MQTFRVRALGLRGSTVTAALAALAVTATLAAGPLAAAAAPPSVTIAIGLDATVDAAGNVTLLVTAPGCAVTPPERYPEIVVQARNPVTGEVGEGGVAIGGFTSPGQGSAVIPAGTPVTSFLVTVSCNLGALGGTQTFTLTAPVATPVATAPAFTG